MFYGIRKHGDKYVAIPLEFYLTDYEKHGYLTIYRSREAANEYCEVMNGSMPTKQLNGITLAQDMAKFVNGMGHNNFDFVKEMMNEHRTLQQQSFELMMDCIKAWSTAYDHKAYDGRNEATCKLCNQIYNQFKDEWFVPYI
jgi:hypothetical protein